LDSIRARGKRLLGAAAFDVEWQAGLLLSSVELAELARTIAQRGGGGPLTSRQREVAALVSEGLTNAQIAARLHLSERTVENHIFNALGALGFHNRVQLATWITQHPPDGAR
jgi:DNA-binding NarL/FixJ family response regulator